ncbi:MAG: hypothetical protein AUJ72_04475 [Candidatus Omnitrophica bacterium CG1_02_46_14]|nr:MAG: hypothetical protein AUJ72_04475 [Candidatus Omnitrophica bacterium CG1_02_46_14]
MAKKFNCPRPVVEKYIESLSLKSPISESHTSRLVLKVPTIFLTLILFFLTFLTYSNSLRYGFVWDDIIQITENPLVKDVSLKGMTQIFKQPVGVIKGKDYTSYSYRPVQTLSFNLDHRLWGNNPAGYHFMNIMLQCLTAIFLFILLLKLLNDREIAFWASAFFAIHPVQIAAVTYISGRAEILASLFMIGAFYAFYKSLASETQKRAVYLVISSSTFFLSLLTKELSVVLPLVFVAYYFIYRRQKNYKISWIHFAGVFIVLAVYIAVRLRSLGALGQGAIGQVPLGDRILGALLVIPYYARLLFLPFGLHMAWQFPRADLSLLNSIVVLGALLVILLVVFAWLSKKSTCILFGWCWFFIFMVPVLNIFVLLNGPMAEHWLYNACIGLFIVMVSLLLGYASKNLFVQKIAEPLLGIFLIYFTLTTWHSSEIWKDEISLYKNILKYSQHDPNIFNNLGAVYTKKGMLNEAEENFKKALELDPNHKNALSNLRTLERQRLGETANEN